MELVHSNIETAGEKPKKKVPLYKDKEALALGLKKWIAESEERALKARSK